MCWGSRDQEVPGVSLPTFSTRESRPGRGAERPLSGAVGAESPKKAPGYPPAPRQREKEEKKKAPIKGDL